MWSVDSQIGNLLHGMLGAFALPVTVAVFLALGASLYFHGWALYKRGLRKTPSAAYVRRWVFGFGWRVVLIGFTTFALGAIASNQPKIVLDSGEDASRRAVRERAAEDLPDMKPVPIVPKSDEERERGMRTLDTETDARTLERN